MSTIKFIVGVAIVSFALMGFITLDPAFKGAAKSNPTAKELSMNEPHLNVDIQANLDQ
jgi:hypothetical protein